jgi:hypothetical protein
MPIYATCCKTCALEGSVFRKIDVRDELPPCPCGGELYRLITKSFVQGSFEPYISPASGQVIDSWSKRREEMSKGGYITWEPGLDKDIARNKIEQQEKALKPIHDTVDQLVTSLNTAGKLENSNAL